MKSLLHYRHLAKNFLHREIQNRYVGTGVGIYLALLHPLLQLAVYTFVFSVVFKQGLAELNGRSFVLFLALSLWPWLMFREGIGRATQAIVGNAALVGKIAFPRELLVYAAVSAPFIVHLVGFSLIIALLAAFGEPIAWLGLPNWLFLGLGWYLTALAAGLFLSAIQVYWRDLDHLMETFWLLLFYVTPILFSVSAVPAAFRPWINANPLAYVVVRMREVLLHGTPQWLLGDFLFLAIALGLFVAARAWFHRLEERFDDAL